MKCEDAQRLISCLLDGEVSSEEKAALEGHLAQCASCRAKAEKWKRNDVIVREGLLAAAPPTGLAERIVRRSEGSVASGAAPKPVQGIRWGRWLARAAAAAVVIFGITDGFLRLRLSGIETEPPQESVLLANAEAAPQSVSMATVRIRATRQDVGTVGVKVSLCLRRQGEKDVEVGEGKTGADGVASIQTTYPAVPDGEYQLVARALGPKGEQEVSRTITLKRDHKVFLSTDKPLYQPAQVIHLRAMVLSAATLAPEAGQDVLVEVLDSKENKVFKKTLKTSKFGIVSADFELADEVLTGEYKVKATVGKTTSDVTLNVKRYVLPKFKVQASSERSWYLPGETIKGTVRADYFFGKTVEGAKVELTWSTFEAEEVKLGEWSGKTDASGSASFEVAVPKVMHGIDLMRGDAPLLVRAKVTDATGHSEEASESLTVAANPIRVVLVPENGRLIPDVENVLYVLTSYPDGRPAQARVTFHANVPLRAVDGTSSGQAMDVQTDETGLAQCLLTPSRMVPLSQVTARDASGHETRLSGGEIYEALGSFSTQQGFLIRPDKAIYKTGETMKLALLAPNAPGLYYVDLVREKRTLKTATVEVKNGMETLAVDIPAEAFGAIQVHAYHVTTQGQVVRDARVVLVDAADALRIEAKLDKETYRPGEKAEIDFEVKNAKGAGVPSALGVGIVDESLFALSEKKPGLERVYAAIEEDIIKPRYQIKNLPLGVAQFAVPEMRPQAPEPRVQTLATVSLAAASADLGEDVQPISTLEPEREALRVRRGAAQRDINDVEEFGGQAGLAFLGFLFFILLPSLAFRDARAAFKGEQSLTGCILPILCTVLILGTLAALLMPSLSLARKSARFGGAVQSLDEGKVMAPAELQDKLGFDEAGLERQGRAHTLKQFKGGPEGPEPSESESLATVTGPEKPRTAPPRLRQWFPETLLWTPELVTDESGHARLTVPNVADSISTWRITAGAVSARGEMGGMGGALRVFQDFFVDPDLPVALTQGDRVTVPVAVYNWLKEPQEVTLLLRQDDWFKVIEGGTKRSVRMEPNSVGVAQFPIEVVRIGNWKVHVEAQGSKGLNDAIERVVRVLPNGKETEFGMGGRLAASAQQTVTLPREAIEGASVLLVKLCPGTCSQVTDGLDHMLQMPFG